MKYSNTNEAKFLQRDDERHHASSVALVINGQGAVVVQDNSEMSDLICTDVVRAKDSMFKTIHKGGSMKIARRKLPDRNELVGLRNEIHLLSNRERDLSGPIKMEFRRQISEIRNLYRLIRSEVLEPRNQTPSRYAAVHTNILFKNWDKMKADLTLAESYCE